MFLLQTKYITEQGEKNLPSYKYVGSDSSLLYKHFFSPFAQWLVDNVIPIWLAPNVITLVGFGCTLLPHLIILAMYPDQLAGPVPGWLCFFAAIGQFFYMNLDNADGKQARKTGSSSPLGLLFDHGCDALNTFISGLSMFTVFQMGNTPMAVFAFMIAMVPFFMATWEEYYVDGLHLPLINGPNEGLVGLIFLYIVSGLFGTDIWTKHIGPLQLNVLLLFGFSIMAIATIFTNIMNVHKKTPEKFGQAIYNLSTLIFMVLTMLVVCYMSPTNIISRHARIFIYFVGFSFGKLVGHLQATHVAHDEFKQFRRSIIVPFAIIFVNTLYSSFSSGGALFSEDLVLYLCFITSLVAYAHFVWSVIPQFTNALKIYVFKIGAKPDTEEVELRRTVDDLEFNST